MLSTEHDSVLEKTPNPCTLVGTEQNSYPQASRQVGENVIDSELGAKNQSDTIKTKVNAVVGHDRQDSSANIQAGTMLGNRRQQVQQANARLRTERAHEKLYEEMASGEYDCQALKWVGAMHEGEEVTPTYSEVTECVAPLNIGPLQYKATIESKWPYATPEALDKARTHMLIYNATRATAVPNYVANKQLLASNMKIDTWRHMLQNYQDRKICEFLEFGWPIGYVSENITEPTLTNHKSACDYQEDIDTFISKECKLGAMLGPFDEPPFVPWTQISPMMTRTKKDTDARRVIIDLSFPTGHSVNTGIPKGQAAGISTAYTLPAITDLTDLVKTTGFSAFMWKCDLERAYRQMRIDPLAYPLLGIKHRDKYYIDICPSFGCRTSGHSQQRVSEALVYLMNAAGYNCLAYVDDFAGVQSSYGEAMCAFEYFHKLCEQLGMVIAHEKSAKPNTEMEWLGYHVDSNEMTVKIPAQKLGEVIAKCQYWLHKKSANKRETQSLVGKLAHISSCVKHARKFMSRILFFLRTINDNEYKYLSTETKKDIAWFGDCATMMNCKILIGPSLSCVSIECDACLQGGGASPKIGSMP